MEKGQKGFILLLGACALVASLFLMKQQGWHFEKTEGLPVLSSGIEANRLLPVYCVNTEKPQIALSFDAAWGNEDTQKLLDILEDKNVKATFFLTGSWVESYPEDVKRIYEAGHELGNHSLHHYDMTTISQGEMENEVMSVHKAVKDLTGYDMKVFRPPYGAYNDQMIETVRSCGYQVIQWDVDSLDWKNYGVDSIIDTVCDHKHLGNGSIILCHNGAEYTAEALGTLIDNLEAAGYEFVRMSELVDLQNYNMDVEGRQQ